MRKIRKQKGYTQQKLAKKLNYGSTAIANYESGRNEPSLDDLLRLCDIFDVTVDEMLGAKPRNIDEYFQSSFKKLSDKKQKIVLELMESLQAWP